MRTHLILAAICAFGASIQAQSTYQVWDMFPGTTSFATRNSLGAEEIHQGVHDGSHRGVMDVGGIASIQRLSMFTQDQNCATQETFDFVIRSGTDAAGPDGSTAGILGSINGLDLPPSPTNGPCGWNISTTLTAPNAIQVPNAAFWSFGARIGPATGWPLDGQTIQASLGSVHSAHALAEDQAWAIIGAATTAIHPSGKRSWRISTYATDGAVLRYRCDGKLGYGGSFPVVSTSSDPKPWDARLDGGPNMAFATPIVALAITRTTGFPVFGGANLYLGRFNSAVFFGPPAGPSGVAYVPLLPWIPAIGAGIGSIHGQGVLDANGVALLTNSQTIRP